MRQMELQAAQHCTELNDLHSKMCSVNVNQSTVQTCLDNTDTKMRVVKAEVESFQVQLAMAEEWITTNVDTALQQMSGITQSQLEEIMKQLKDMQNEQGSFFTRIANMFTGRSQ